MAPGMVKRFPHQGRIGSDHHDYRDMWRVPIVHAMVDFLKHNQQVTL
jgi:hypothetical protein